METVRFGRTGLMVSRTSFGAIPIQRLTFDESTALLRRAFDGGVTLYDTARGYTDSEERIGAALGDVRRHVVLCTKTPSSTRAAIFADCETSLRMLRTDVIDVYQFHNPKAVPAPGDEMYEAALDLKRQGKIRFIGITNHTRALAEAAVDSGWYDTLQFPLSPLSDEGDLDLARRCREADVGLLAMKALAGGLITNGRTAFVFLRQYANIVPIYGLQHMWELEEFLGYEADPPAITSELAAVIEHDRRELSGSFCRGCGYCLPCPAKIPISMAARISFMLRRANPAGFLTGVWQENMRRVDDCTHCNHCKLHCPYGLDTPNLLRVEQARYFAYLKEHAGQGT